MNKYIVIDLETSIKNRGEDAIGNNKASPFHPENEIVWEGWTDTTQNSYISVEHSSDLKDNWENIMSYDTVVVGHNIRFDLHYLRKTYPDFWEEWLRNGTIWDTQLVEYLLSGQTWMFPALGNKKDKEGNVSVVGVAEKYGGHDKDNRIKEYWDNGVDTEDIPDEEIKPYLYGDVENTEKVFKGQLERVIEEGLLPLVRTQMEALLATAEMEWNGMHVDTGQLDWDLASAEEEYMTVLDIIDKVVDNRISEPRLFDINSNNHLSILLFGGELEVKERIVMKDPSTGDIIRYKTGVKAGEPRHKWIKTIIKANPLFPAKAEWKAGKKGIYYTNDEVLEDLSKKGTFPIVNAVRDKRRLEKDINTYYKPYRDLVWPDGKIHHNLNHCSTRTGRLSSSNPNLQNVTGD